MSSPPQGTGVTTAILVSNGAGGYTRIQKILSSAGAVKYISHREVDFQNSPADGDRIINYIWCDGTETILELGTYRYSDRGKFDIYLNDEKAYASTFDDYAASGGYNIRHITLTKTVKKGINKVELRVNGKNASSTNYYVTPEGISLQ